jgi:hypothetical protein
MLKVKLNNSDVRSKSNEKCSKLEKKRRARME